MFQTEPIRFLQSLGNEWITAFMVAISEMGYAPFYIAVISIALFGVSFRKGFLLLQMVMWVVLATELLKNAFGLPRPSDVDVNVLLPGKDYPNPSPFSEMGATSFWGLPQAEAIDFYRAQPEWSFGLPSGHTSTAATFWGGLALVFKSTTVRLLAAAFIVLMPLSRMYLGRHFLGDVLGGLTLGGLFVGSAYAVFVRPGTGHRLLTATRLALGTKKRYVMFMTLLIVAPLPLLFGSWVGADTVGRLFGINVAFALVAAGGYPDDAGSVPKRVGRVLLAPLLYVAAKWGVGRLLALAALDDDLPLVQFVAEAIPTFLLLWGTIKVSLATGLYRGRLGAD